MEKNISNCLGTLTHKIREVFRELKLTECLSDVTLLCTDGKLKAHKLVLIGNSPVFKSMLLQSERDIVVYLRGVSKSEMEWALEFMYLGETQLPQDHLETFLNLAKEFKMKGILDNVGTSIGPEGKVTEMKAEMKAEHDKDIEPSEDGSTVNVNIFDSEFSSRQIYLNQPSKALGKKLSNGGSQWVNTNEVNDFRQKFHCDECDYFALWKDMLRKHVDREHKGIRYPCNLCNYQAGSKPNLIDHKASKHKINPKFRCKLCDFCTNHVNTKKKHISQHNGDQDIFDCYKNSVKTKVIK